MAERITPTPEQMMALQQALHPLIGVQLDLLNIPREAMLGFEPSQIGSIVGALMDACLPQLEKILPDNALLTQLGLTKYGRSMQDREGYPDYMHTSGLRVELKLLYVDPLDAEMKRPATPREPSARVTQKVTVKNVVAAADVLLVAAYQLRGSSTDPDLYSPTIIALGLFPMSEIIHARDQRLTNGGGKWFGDYAVPAVLSRQALGKLKRGEPVDLTTYGRKEDEKKDLNEDTNFGKLNRIPYEPLRQFLITHGYRPLASRIRRLGAVTLAVDETADELPDES